MELDLPAGFIRLNEEDPGWLAGLPDLITRLSAQWFLTPGPHFPDIRYNYVTPATLSDGTPCVLKVSRHIEDTKNESAALRLWNGEGAVRLLSSDLESGALLLERLKPGTKLAEVAESDDDAATLIAADIIRQLWRPVPEGSGLRALESWCDAFERNRNVLSNGASGFPATLFRRADALRQELLDSTEAPAVLHGDLHHFNVLRAQRAPWIAIDPKGLAGDRHFDVGQFLRNPEDMPAKVNRRRLDIFQSELGLDRTRLNAWCLVHAVLLACWEYEDGRPWQTDIAYAEQTLMF